MNKKYLIIAMVMLVGLVGIALGYSWYNTNNPSFSGALISPAQRAPDFSLTSQTGETVRLSDFLGKYVLIFFGFTNCDSECPLTMGYLKQMRDRLGPLADQVQVILITSDPARDTPEVLGEYLITDPSFIGLTST
jgi:protein SCO1/2